MLTVISYGCAHRTTNEPYSSIGNDPSWEKLYRLIKADLILEKSSEKKDDSSEEIYDSSGENDKSSGENDESTEEVPEPDEYDRNINETLIERNATLLLANYNHNKTTDPYLISGCVLLGTSYRERIFLFSCSDN